MTLEEAQEKIIELNDSLKNSKITIDGLREQLENTSSTLSGKDEEIQKLKEHNMKLFLRVTNEEQMKEPEEPEEPEVKKTPWENFRLEF